MTNPSHPGAIVRHKRLEPLGVAVTEAAQVLLLRRAVFRTRSSSRAESGAPGIPFDA